MFKYETFESASYLDTADVFTEEANIMEELAEKAYARYETDPDQWSD